MGKREELQAEEQSLLARLKAVRASMAFLDRRDIRQKIAIGAAVAIVVVGLIYKFVG